MIIEIGDKNLITENEDFWIAPDATVIGDVRMAKDSSIWFHYHP
jgi:carbonic anhydrase/acetyltransferase-like protein (isoleucine patch superfamily)